MGVLKMKNYLQPIIRLLFVALFIVLIFTGRVQIWVGIFLLAVASTFLFSRLYCGWICPINTVMKVVVWVKRKLGLKDIKIPSFLAISWIKYVVLGLFILFFVISMTTGRMLPVLPILFAAGIVLTVSFPEELWHRYICPYGTIFTLPGSVSKYAMVIAEEKCNRCGSCMKVCPSRAIENIDGRFVIIKSRCLVCLDCRDVCKQEAISYC
jgi:ferredoxin-type protein NapH